MFGARKRAATGEAIAVFDFHAARYGVVKVQSQVLGAADLRSDGVERCAPLHAIEQKRGRGPAPVRDRLRVEKRPAPQGLERVEAEAHARRVVAQRQHVAPVERLRQLLVRGTPQAELALPRHLGLGREGALGHAQDRCTPGVEGPAVAGVMRVDGAAAG